MKDIYELLNDIDIEDYEEADVSEFEKERVKYYLNKKLKTHSNNKKIKFLSIVVASIIIFIASSIVIFFNPTFASDIPIINKLLQNAYGNKNIDFIPYSDFIGQTVNKNGIELTFNNVVISNDSMILDFTIKNNEDTLKKGTFNDSSMMPQKIKINDIDMPTNGKTSSELIDEHTARILETIDIQSEDYTPEGNLNVEINIYEIFNLKDTFDFKFKYDKTAQDKKSISKTYDKEINLDNKKITLNKAYASPLSCSISFTSDYSNHYDFWFIAIDNNGNPLTFNCSSASFNGNYMNSIFYLSNKDMKQVNFIPYTKSEGKHTQKTQPIDLNNKENFIIYLTDDIGVLIKDLIIDGDYLVVKYNNLILGKETSILGDSFINLSLTNNSSIIPFANYDTCENLYKKYADNYDITSIFKVNDERNLSIELEYNNSLKFFKDTSITLDLPQ